MSLIFSIIESLGVCILVQKRWIHEIVKYAKYARKLMHKICSKATIKA